MPATPAPAVASGAAANRTLLEALHRELSAEIEEASAIVTIWTEPAATAGDDDVDTGSRAAQRDQDAAVLTSLRERRDQVERSLARIDQGEYGRCERCGEAIPAARIEAFPSATTCVTCQRRNERRL